MTSVYAVVEGDGEQRFAQRVLAVHLAMKDIFLQAARVGKPGHKGGNRWQVARKDIVNFLKMGKPERPVHVTSMFDYYGMTRDWPGRDGRGCWHRHTGPPPLSKQSLTTSGP
jgi:hypothetical protein